MAQEVEIELQAVGESSTPIFVPGHEGDITQIAGFQYEQDILIGSDVIGTSSGTITLLSPPLNLLEPFIFATVQTTSSFLGLGTFEESGYAVGLTNSNTLTTGEVTLSVTGSVSNGTGALADIYGVVTGIGTTNIATSQGTMKEIYRLRLGY
ncbi:MAG: hypothetical protein L6N96_03205 [Candidatus Methylarchaceae archaeon HK02M2]|nr:hypothetical protein [Candidatus Methylarchaceae archaeon HK02M2]